MRTDGARTGQAHHRTHARLRGDRINAARRRVSQRGDQLLATARRRLGPKQTVAPFDGHARFGIVTVNYSTTDLLKLQLLTLCEQDGLERLARLVIVDNDNRDGGTPFLTELAAGSNRIELLTNRWFPTHARGLRLGTRRLIDADRNRPPGDRSNILLITDSDIVYRRSDTLESLAGVFEADDVAAAGELRHGLYPYPEAQASFVAVRIDQYVRRRTSPFVHHGAPSYPMQRSLWRDGQSIADFPSNKDGYILHRGRSGVASSRIHRPHDAYATAGARPHYMQVPDGDAIWAARRDEFADLLDRSREPELLRALLAKLS